MPGSRSSRKRTEQEQLATPMGRPATEIRVTGIVQGVGFRPFVYRLARQLDLTGFIANRGDTVIITVAGHSGRVAELINHLRNHPPPLARILSLDQREAVLPEDAESFSIVASKPDRLRETHVSPDIATCPDCLREVLDSSDRRHRYPFTNCTNCGPRFSIIRSLPYDRSRTTMDAFPMCPACREEYLDPGNRRFHAQPNACPDCGPKLWWHDANDASCSSDSPLEQAVSALLADRIIGIKGLGGFHLAANAFSAKAVARLRERKQRPAKPFAVMVPDLKTAKKLCAGPDCELAQLESITRPIVLLRKKQGSGLAENLAPDIDELGIMLPYTPLHHLLFSHPGIPPCLVMSSGNTAGEPLCKDNDEALARLGAFCDGFLLHDREIHTRVDDSVVRVIDRIPRFLRRARGYAPAPVSLPREMPSVLAVGGELKNCFCLTRGRDAFMSQHIGNMNNLPTLEFLEQTLARLKDLLEIEPQTVAADLHPDYLSSRFADTLNLPVTKVQHHWAHAASVMAEHGLDETLGIILDGTGYGPDGTVWGGEVLHCTFREYRRLGRLSPLPLPGGDKAAREPWRMALSGLHSAGRDDARARANLAAIPEQQQQFILEMLDKNVNCPATSSCGRLFDCISSLLGICHDNTFEGQAAMELEAAAAGALAGRPLLDAYPALSKCLPDFLRERNSLLELAMPDFLSFFIRQMTSGRLTTAEMAILVHLFLVSGFGNMVDSLSRKTGIATIALSGGCVQNRILAEGFIDFFSRSHLTLFTNVQVPANDGGLALGQAVIGGMHVPGDTNAG